MSTHIQATMPVTNPVKDRDQPLYASPWVALFFILRRGLMQPRKSL